MSTFAIDGTVRHVLEPAGTELADRLEPSGRDTVLNPGSTWIILAPYISRDAAPLTKIVNALIQKTGWSQRRLAQIVGTTHPTIGSITRGREPERVPGLPEALTKTADVVSRMSDLVGGDQRRLNLVLTAVGNTGETPLRLLSAGKYGQALLLVMDSVAGATDAQSGQLLKPTQLRDPSKDVISLLDDDDD
ncbi:hypothetical protein JIG36_05630 [Actinoplanes sp. LDG1-06]|uniref:XRE family transcriptional regulator n=1 Tax=Paractinoplanes ovalisporus TaxID=2810368 RepID=A0ABS2A5D7_9ACTN|nr:hypothetical protein [Actinoplanes ovalisporus]MBM2615039.1 hypothetical protein [Actinoplanes ovalisporus]